MSNFLVQNTELDDVDEVVELTMEIITTMISDTMISIEVATYAMAEAIFEIISATIEDCMADFGYDITINDYEDITPEILEITGVRLPQLSEFKIEEILYNKNICFIRANGEIINGPQIPLIGGRSNIKHNGLFLEKNPT